MNHGWEMNLGTMKDQMIVNEGTWDFPKEKHQTHLEDKISLLRVHSEHTQTQNREFAWFYNTLVSK